MSFLSRCGGFLKDQLRYNTVQLVAIKDVKLGLLFRLCQLGIILYIALNVIVKNKGYQRFGPVSGTTVVKVKGSAYNAGGLPWLNRTTQEEGKIDYTQTYDSNDLVFPPTERDATFITTDLYITPNQTRGLCFPGSDDWWTLQPLKANATAECAEVCVRGTLVHEADTRTGGVYSGHFDLDPIPGDDTRLNCFCELHTWCPDEHIPDEPGPFAFRLHGVGEWTVSFRQQVQFHDFGIQTNNFFPKNSTVPPLYTVGEMVAAAGLDYEVARTRGAVLLMQSVWDCNFDFSVDSCLPDVSFLALGWGFNFRRVDYTSNDGMQGKRDLIKQFGVRTLIVLSGKAGKFDAAALLTNIGAGIGLLAVAALVADFAALNLLGHRALYGRAKVHEVEVVGHGKLRRRTESQWERDQEAAEAGYVNDGERFDAAFQAAAAGERGPASMHLSQQSGTGVMGGTARMTGSDNFDVDDEKEEPWGRRRG